MHGRPHIWLRQEARPDERRAPLVPDDARRLVATGATVTVEDSPTRVFPLADYVAAGCRPAEPGAWVDAARDTWVLGLKELPARPEALVHRHVLFGHAYKGQRGAGVLLRRFRAGGGELYDLEQLTDDTGRRLAAFGYWAGYVGAALGVLRRAGELDSPLGHTDETELLRRLRRCDPPGRALVVGADGRAGRGALAALEAAGAAVTRWDVAETRDLDRPALRRHHLLVNTVLSTVPGPQLLTTVDLDRPDRLLDTVVDVSCDVDSPCNVLPIYDRCTTWSQPARRLHAGPPPLDLIAIDNLPSLVPAEASRSFSADLLPLLVELRPDHPAWRRCRQAFHDALARTKETTRA
ncbi:saccharopine dehydrogenase [Micromonospora sp. KLBMP9576]|uniref:saccharopine dehydrogenase n=1 Tax=Micromonospora sp. KLBMP9576 TaxID=3424769 RepID=UPI003D8B10EA